MEFIELVEFMEFIELVEFMEFVEFIEFMEFFEFIELGSCVGELNKLKKHYKLNKLIDYED